MVAVGCATPKVNVGSELLVRRPNDGTPVIWFQNESGRRLSLESYGERIGKAERISGTFTFSHGGNVGYSDFGDRKWRDSTGFDSYFVRVMPRPDPDAWPKTKLLEIHFSPANLNVATTEKALRVEFRKDHAVVHRNGVSEELAYQAEPN